MTSVSTSSEATPSPASNSSPSASDWLANCLLHGERPQSNQVGILISQMALRQIDAHCRSDFHRELGGVLLGKAFQRQGQQWVAIAAALPATSSDHGPIHFTFTADAWAKINRDRETHHPQLAIVGWFHTHPDLGVFYSADDVVVHTVAFRELWHIGLVVDPVRQDACFFGWDQQELRDGLERAISPIEGFYERLDEQTQSVTDWRIGRDRAWNRQPDRMPTTLSGVNQADDLIPAENQYLLPPNHWPTISPTIALWVGLIGLLVTLCLLLFVIVPQTRQMAALQNVTLQLAGETIEIANETGAAACANPDLRLITPLAGGITPIGEELAIVGTAQVAAANRYTLQIRPSISEQWTTVDSFRRDHTLAVLGRLDTSNLSAGSYQLLLAARDNQNQIIGETCMVSFELK